MMNVPENELFSAYLDGELTAAEQAEMERLLATSPAARQLLEELRALSATLQSLPVHKLNEDLSQHVLRMAERRMLSGQTESDPFSPRAVPSTGRWRALASRLSRPKVPARFRRWAGAWPKMLRPSSRTGARLSNP